MPVVRIALAILRCGRGKKKRWQDGAVAHVALRNTASYGRSKYSYTWHEIQLWPSGSNIALARSQGVVLSSTALASDEGRAIASTYSVGLGRGV